jgi:hypothetical protein
MQLHVFVANLHNRDRLLYSARQLGRHVSAKKFYMNNMHLYLPKRSFINLRVEVSPANFSPSLLQKRAKGIARSLSQSYAVFEMHTVLWATPPPAPIHGNFVAFYPSVVS